MPTPDQILAALSMPLRVRRLPPGAAGTRLAGGIILSGDDAPEWERYGWPTWPMHVRCSAKVCAGAQTIEPGEQVIIAVDRNGASVERIAELTGAEDGRPAEGIYDGTVAPAFVGHLHGPDAVLAAHAALWAADLPGFGCFAILTLR